MYRFCFGLSELTVGAQWSEHIFRSEIEIFLTGKCNNHWVNSFFASSALCLHSAAGQSLILYNPRDMSHRRRSRHITVQYNTFT